MLTVCSLKVFLHPALHYFQIDMRELYKRPGSKIAPLTLSGNCVKYILHDMFDGSMFPHADENNCDLVFVLFNGDCLASCMCHILLYP